MNQTHPTKPATADSQPQDAESNPSTMNAQPPQIAINRLARERARQQVSPAVNLAAPGVEFSSKGRLLILGAEHRVRLAVSRLASLTSITALITEPMPEQFDAEMEAAAALAEDSLSGVNLYRVPLSRLSGYLGKFEALVLIDAQPQSLAKLALGSAGFDLVLDLGRQPQLAMALKPVGYFAPADAEALEAALLEIPGLQGGFEKPRYIKVNNDLCAHSNSNMTGCTRCLDVCPADAISVLAGKVQIDSHLCHGAGGCASACPTSAIRYGFPQPGLLLDSLQRTLASYRLAGGATPQLLLHDAASVEQQLPGLLESLPGQYLPLQVEEMGSAGMEVWLSAIALGAVGVTLLVDDSLLESVRLVLDAEIETTNRLLQGLQLSVRVEQLDSLALLARVADPRAAESSPSRIEPMLKLDLYADKRQQVSQAMNHLYQQQATATMLSTEVLLVKGAPFGQVAVNSAGCTLCMSCVSICPTKALSSSPNTPRLSFSEDACVQCGLCTQACPEDVLSLESRYLLDPQSRIPPRVLHEEPPFCCVSCGEAFATQSLVALMLKKLAGHSMFDKQGLRRLEMCADCRVIDIVKTDPGGDLFEFAQGRSPDEGEINLANTESSNVAPSVLEVK